MKSKENQNVELNDYFLNEKRFKSDSSANKVANRIFEEESPEQILATIASITKNSDKIPESLPDYLVEYFDQTYEMSNWATSRQLKISAQFFEDNAKSILMCLMTLSLPYCYAAGVDAEVLLISQRIKNDTKKRLLETGQFVFDVMAHDAFEPSGRGIRSIQKVRLMHAVVRYHIKKRHLWDISKGLPINQEALVGTNLAFSLIILRGLQRLNISISNDEEQAYISRWNLIGFIMGVDKDLLFDEIKKMIELEEKIRRRHFQKTDSGLELTKCLVDSTQDFFSEKSKEEFLYPLMSYLLGKEVSNILDIPYSTEKTELISLIKLKNAFDQVFTIQSGRVDLNMKIQMRKDTEALGVNFQSPLNL